MEKGKPIKRHEAIQPLSRDHYHGLLLCWKIRQGHKKGVSPERMMEYARHFFEQHLREHFREEEQYLFPLLGLEDPLIDRACNEHKRLEYLFFEEKDLAEAVKLIALELDHHIRFEERELFNKIQEKAGAGELQRVNKQLHSRPADQPQEDWPDPFWQNES